MWHSFQMKQEQTNVQNLFSFHFSFLSKHNTRALSKQNFLKHTFQVKIKDSL